MHAVTVTRPPDRVLSLCAINVLWPSTFHVVHSFVLEDDSLCICFMLAHLGNALCHGDYGISRYAFLGMFLVWTDVGEHLSALVIELGMSPKLFSQTNILVIYLHASGCISLDSKW